MYQYHYHCISIVFEATLLINHVTLCLCLTGEHKDTLDRKDDAPSQAVPSCATPSKDLPQQTSLPSEAGNALAENEGEHSSIDEKKALPASELQPQVCEAVVGNSQATSTNPSQDSSLQNSETQTAAKNACKEAACEPENEVTVAQGEGDGGVESPASASDGAKGQRAKEAEECLSTDGPLINKKRMETDLTDDFWDFESPKPTEASTPNAENLFAGKVTAENIAGTQGPQGDQEHLQLQQAEKEQVQSQSDQKLEAEQWLQKKDLSKNSEGTLEKVGVSQNTKKTDLEQSGVDVSCVSPDKKIDDNVEKHEEQIRTTDASESEYVTCPNTPDKQSDVEKKVVKCSTELIPDPTVAQTPVPENEVSSVDIVKGTDLPAVPAGKGSPEASGGSLSVPTHQAESMRSESPGIQSLLDSSCEDIEMIEFLPKLSLRKVS